MKVRDVRGKQLGTIRARHSCCIEFGTGLTATVEAILAADAFGVELICNHDSLPRYSCGLHAVQPATPPRYSTS